MRLLHEAANFKHFFSLQISFKVFDPLGQFLHTGKSHFIRHHERFLQTLYNNGNALFNKSWQQFVMMFDSAKFGTVKHHDKLLPTFVKKCIAIVIQSLQEPFMMPDEMRFASV